MRHSHNKDPHFTTRNSFRDGANWAGSTVTALVVTVGNSLDYVDRDQASHVLYTDASHRSEAQCSIIHPRESGSSKARTPSPHPRWFLPEIHITIKKIIETYLWSCPLKTLTGLVLKFLFI